MRPSVGGGVRPCARRTTVSPGVRARGRRLGRASSTVRRRCRESQWSRQAAAACSSMVAIPCASSRWCGLTGRCTRRPAPTCAPDRGGMPERGTPALRRCRIRACTLHSAFERRTRASASSRLRVLQCRPSAPVGRRPDLFVRVHILSRLRRGRARGALSELRRGTRCAAQAPRRQVGEVSGLDGARIQAAGVRNTCGVVDGGSEAGRGVCAGRSCPRGITPSRRHREAARRSPAAVAEWGGRTVFFRRRRR